MPPGYGELPAAPLPGVFQVLAAAPLPGVFQVLEHP